jgi:hypothetical protein
MNKTVIFLIFTLLPFSAHSHPSEPHVYPQYDSRQTAIYRVKKFQESVLKQPKKTIAGTGITLFGLYGLETAVNNYQIRKEGNCDSACGETICLSLISLSILTTGIYLLYDVFTAKDNVNEEEPNTPNIVTK